MRESLFQQIWLVFTQYLRKHFNFKCKRVYKKSRINIITFIYFDFFFSVSFATLFITMQLSARITFMQIIACALHWRWFMHLQNHFKIMFLTSSFIFIPKIALCVPYLAYVFAFWNSYITILSILFIQQFLFDSMMWHNEKFPFVFLFCLCFFFFICKFIIM